MTKYWKRLRLIKTYQVNCEVRVGVNTRSELMLKSESGSSQLRLKQKSG